MATNERHEQMTNEIIRLREELVGLSSDPIKTRELLDKLTKEEILQHDIESLYHVGKNDIDEEKDFDFFKVCKTRNGYLIHYKGGYTVYVDEKNYSTCSAIELLTSDKSEDEGEELAKSAIEMLFRLPLFVFSNAPVTFSIATIATRYLVYLQDKGEVPTEDTDNPEYDKALQMINEIVENITTGLEKEGKEWERRNGINVEEEGEKQIEGEGKGEGDKSEAKA